MKRLYADGRLEKAGKGYHAIYDEGDEPGTWVYEIKDPAGGHLAAGTRTGTESDLRHQLRKTLKRNNGLFGTGSGKAPGWSWTKTSEVTRNAH